MIKVRPDALEAKAEALESCSLHLELDWTDEPLEIAEGKKLVRQFRRQAMRLRHRAAEINRGYDVA